MLTQEILKDILRYDPETGIFIRLKDTYHRKFKKDEIAGTLHSDGCVVIGIKGKYYKAHRLAFLYMEGEFPPHGVDHKDGKRNNNRWSNLRKATCSDNNQNLALRTKSKSGHIGVSFSNERKKWVAQIQVHGKHKYLGRFEKIEDAIDAYKCAKLKYHKFNPVLREG